MATLSGRAVLIPLCVCVSTPIQVVSRVCTVMDIPSMEAGGIKPWMTQPLKDLQYLMREVNMFLEVCGKLFYQSCFFLICTVDCMLCDYLFYFFNIYISSFCQCTDAVASICTLYELGKSLASLKEKKHYEELNLGPLCKLPIIHRMFKIDSNTRDDDIHQIETVDILKVSLASCSS